MAKLDDKDNFQLSGSTMYRRREPTNPRTAAHFTQMVFDHSVQHPVLPDADKYMIAEITRDHSDASRTLDKSGRPKALNVMVGGSPDYHGAVWKPGKSDTSPPPNSGRVSPKDTPFGTLKSRRT